MSESGFEGYTPNESIVLPEGPISGQKISDVCFALAQAERGLHLSIDDNEGDIGDNDLEGIRNRAIQSASHLFLETAVPDKLNALDMYLMLARRTGPTNLGPQINSLLPESVTLSSEQRNSFISGLEKIVEGTPAQIDELDFDTDDLEFDDDNLDEEVEQVDEKRIARDDGVKFVLDILNGSI